MDVQNVFVGSVAILGGCTCLVFAVSNLDTGYRFWAANFVETRWGRSRARQFYFVLGAGLIVLGSAVSMGWRWPILGRQVDAMSTRRGPLPDRSSVHSAERTKPQLSAERHAMPLSSQPYQL